MQVQTKVCAHCVWLVRVGLSLAWCAGGVGGRAVRRAMEAEQAVNELQQHRAVPVGQQEQELDHLRRCGEGCVHTKVWPDGSGMALGKCVGRGCGSVASASTTHSRLEGCCSCLTLSVTVKWNVGRVIWGATLIRGTTVARQAVARRPSLTPGRQDLTTGAFGRSVCCGPMMASKRVLLQMKTLNRRSCHL